MKIKLDCESHHYQKELSVDDLIEWKDTYNIGVDEIDLQHQYFTQLINRLDFELERNIDNEYRFNLIEELLKYASFHFLSEENIMFSSNYSDIEDHKRLHSDLINELNEKIIFFKMSKLTHNEIISFLKNWFLDHTVEIDMKFGNFLLKQE